MSTAHWIQERRKSLTFHLYKTRKPSLSMDLSLGKQHLCLDDVCANFTIRISMPLLAGVGSEPSRLPGIAINNAGEPLNVDFPQLSYANKLLDFIGNFERFQNSSYFTSALANASRISLPSLGSAKSIEIQANSPFDVNLTSLLNVTHLSLLGNISSLVITALFIAICYLGTNTMHFIGLPSQSF